MTKILETKPWLVLLVLTCAACKGVPGDTEDTEEPAMEPLFSFAVIADAHVTGPGDHADRLTAAVDWIDTHAEERDIELFLVLGDNGWGGGTTLTRDLLDATSVPYALVIGDNEIHAGDEEDVHITFSPRWEDLSNEFDGYDKPAMPVDNPMTGNQSWFTDYSFDHRGVHFVGLDWNARDTDGIEGEQADLWDFDGGTWRFLVDDVEGLGEGPDNSIVTFSHHAMHLSPGAFILDEMAVIEGFTEPRGDRFYANFGGHYHFNMEQHIEDGGYEVFVTDATWDDEITVRVVEVSGNGLRLEYVHEIIVVE